MIIFKKTKKKTQTQTTDPSLDLVNKVVSYLQSHDLGIKFGNVNEEKNLIIPNNNSLNNLYEAFSGLLRSYVGIENKETQFPNCKIDYEHTGTLTDSIAHRFNIRNDEAEINVNFEKLY